MEPASRVLLFLILILAALDVALIAQACSLEPAFCPTDSTAFQEQVNDTPDGGEFMWSGSRYVVIDE